MTVEEQLDEIHSETTYLMNEFVNLKNSLQEMMSLITDVKQQGNTLRTAINHITTQVDMLRCTGGTAIDCNVVQVGGNLLQSGRINCNVESMNGIKLNGNGSSVPWGP